MKRFTSLLLLKSSELTLAVLVDIISADLF